MSGVRLTRWTGNLLSSCSGSPLRATGPSRSHLGVLPAMADPVWARMPKPPEKRWKGHRNLRLRSLHQTDEGLNRAEVVPLEPQSCRESRAGAERGVTCFWRTRRERGGASAAWLAEKEVARRCGTRYERDRCKPGVLRDAFRDRSSPRYPMSVKGVMASGAPSPIDRRSSTVRRSRRSDRDACRGHPDIRVIRADSATADFRGPEYRDR